MPPTMDSHAGSFFLGRWFGINVRVHYLLLLFGAWQIVSMMNALRESEMAVLWVAPAFFVGLFVSILLHEFGHSLACKLFKGQADEIILWPLGGMALCRPPFHPTAHLVTTVAGPMVTLVIWLTLRTLFPIEVIWKLPLGVGVLINSLKWINLVLLIFNALPAFPMDGGRALRDFLWHIIGHRKATIVAVWIGRVTAGAMIAWGIIAGGGLMIILIGAFVMWSNLNIERVIALDHAGGSGYSLKEHFKQAKRQSAFKKSMRELDAQTLHECSVCKRTEVSDPGLEFRVSSVDDEEYCLEHLPKRKED